MLDIREELKVCCNKFLRDEKETDALNYVQILNYIDRMIRDLGWSNAVAVDVLVNSDEICLRMNVCGVNYSLAIIQISNNKIIFKDILEDDFNMLVNFLIRNNHLLKSYR